MLTVGELAKRCGLTVRTLHHYDTIGLLVPSVRSAAGYRLYDRANIERLHRIQALRQLGLSLTDIGTALSGSTPPLAEVIERQIVQIDRELAKTSRLRQRLLQLRTQLNAGQPLELTDWLDTLELMSMYEKYFSTEEVKQMAILSDRDAQAEWQALVDAVKSAVARGAKPDDEDAKALALIWMRKLQRDTAGNPDFLARLNLMHDEEPAMESLSGITPAVKQFVETAIVEARLAIYRKYLEPGEFDFMRAHYGKQMYAWPPLVADVRRAMDEGVAPDSPQGADLAHRWGELFRRYAGDDPATHARIRKANEQEPDLVKGTWVTPAMLTWLRHAVEAMAKPRLT